MTRTLYITGPISNADAEQVERNLQAFHQAEHQLRKWGYRVINPARNGLPRESDWEAHMRRDIALLMEADAVACLPGVSQSRGARIEINLARALDMDVRELGEWLA